MNKTQKEVQQAHLDAEKKTLNKLKKIYAQASKDCRQKINELNSRTDMQNLQSIIYQKQYQEALKKQIDSILDSLQSDEFNTVADYLTECYENGYVGAMYDIQKQGIPIITPINQKNVVKAVQTDSKLSTNLYTRLGEDVTKLKKTIRTELSRGTANGSSWLEMAEKISNGMNSPFKTSLNNAIRIARTEGHRIQQESALDAMLSAKENGADVVKQWDATLDSRTRPDHQAADGQIRELDEYFHVGGEDLKAPGVGGSAKNVINCRCCVLQRARWALDEDELVALKSRASYFGLDKTDGFKEYKEKYLNITTSNGIIKPTGNSTITKAVGVKQGDSIDIINATVNSNPNYNPFLNGNYPYNNNCQRCVQAYELQRRGFDVEAKGMYSDTNTVSWGVECFTLNGTEKEAFEMFELGCSASDVKKEINNGQNGARYVIYVSWSEEYNYGSHVFIGEKINDTVYYVDPQSGSTDVSYYFEMGIDNKFGYCRIDDKEITSNIDVIKNTVKGK